METIDQFFDEVNNKHQKAQKRERKNQKWELDEMEKDLDMEQVVKPKKRKSTPPLSADEVRDIVQAELEAFKDELKDLIFNECRAANTQLYHGIRKKLYSDIMNELYEIKLTQSYIERKLEAVLEGR